MRKLIFDIETCSYPFESLSESQREYLLKYADKETDPIKKETMKDEAIRYTSLYPFTAKMHCDWNVRYGKRKILCLL